MKEIATIRILFFRKSPALKLYYEGARGLLASNSRGTSSLLQQCDCALR